ncbi:hypothetical protein M758_1G174900 [Ceratodon purpureus]|uniref:Secreted protein n=1 Tax=Ceratodon purpureus TaxID=3225 RepID=A0A8T0J6A9_CERPU|nr:hypothetical protein KC19_1G178100 [Ceratodon purpureus]KAG0630386.1 hypothetical protein M758_1G174900 [Ceratodon purpureus]
MPFLLQLMVTLLLYIKLSTPSSTSTHLQLHLHRTSEAQVVSTSELFLVHSREKLFFPTTDSKA